MGRELVAEPDWEDRKPQSDEARFLTGEFTRAGDFDYSETGGQSAAETGLFCPNTPLCNCGPRSRR